MALSGTFGMWYHPLYTDGIHPEARFPRDRYQLLLDRLEGSEARRHMTVNHPKPVENDLLLLAHDADYVERFLAGELTEKEEKRIGLTPWTPAMIERTQVLLGGAVEATEHALRTGGFAGNMAGGTHHAHRDFGSGYCVFNDLAVCTLHALENLGVKARGRRGPGRPSGRRDGNHSRRRTACLHDFGSLLDQLPFRKSVSDHDLPVAPESGDEVYLNTVREALDICEAFEPDLILYQAGVDGLEADALGKLKVSREGMRQRNHLVFETATSLGVPLVVFMGGGYAKPIDASLDAFYDLFTDAAEWNA